MSDTIDSSPSSSSALVPPDASNFSSISSISSPTASPPAAAASSSSNPNPAAPSSSADAPIPVIRALAKEVVNRIAAGEVIHRPSSALKELLENSIDAKSNRIVVTLKDGGLSIIQIQDNGCGIRQEDFPILCERFTTSKLSEYSDLQSISTFGFRGEALASITHVARVSITSMTRGSATAYRADFRDGKMIDAANGGVELKQPKTCAGVKGTTILIEDLFHNVPQRRNALKNAFNEEYAKCVDMMCKYALHYSGKVSMTCKKHGANNKLDVSTLLTSSHEDNVRTIYGANITKELLPISLNFNAGDCRAHGIGSQYFRVSGLVTHANFSQKKLNFILFINHRLVDSSHLRRMIDTIYAKYLPKGTHPFVYLALDMDPQILDVNVHPTKKEVHFLYEDQMVNAVEAAIEKVLKGANNSRVFYTQSVLGGQGAAPLHAPTRSAPAASPSSSLFSLEIVGGTVTRATDDDSMIDDRKTSDATASSSAEPLIAPMDIDSDVKATSSSPPSNFIPAAAAAPRPLFSQARTGSAPSSSATVAPASQQPQQQRRDNSLVRTDNRQGRIDSFLTQPSQLSSPSATQDTTMTDRSRKRAHEQLVADENDGQAAATAASSSSASRLGTVRVNPPSSRRPKAPVIHLTSVNNLLTIISNSAHQPLSDLFHAHTFVGFVDSTFSLIQHQTKLHLVNVERISAAFFYETVLRLFGHLPLVRFAQPIPIRAMIRIALDHKDAASAAHPIPADRDAYATHLTDMLVSRAAMLQEYFALEISVIDGAASLCGIPELIEQYNPPLFLLPLFLMRLARDVDWTSEQSCFDTIAHCLADFYRFQKEQFYQPDPSLPSMPKLVANVFFPLLTQRAYFTPPRNAAADGTVTQIASLENLYKIFERC